MLPATFDPDAETLDQVARALTRLPGAAYCVPHEYPGAAPAFSPAPRSERPPLAADRVRLYVHIPFCRYHCSFCSFAVRIGADGDTITRYVGSLERELEWVEPGTRLSQLFMGGGTPTALRPELLDDLLAAVFSRTTPYGESVHTVEASPETISPSHVEVLRRRGIGRVSMGIQSLDDGVLAAVHRRHSREQSLAACDLLVNSGLITNIDLIYGLPRQSEASFLADLEAIAQRGVHSFTLYALRLNDRTPVSKALRDDERLPLARLMRWRAVVKSRAEALGYTQTRWHTFKRVDTIAAAHDRLPHFTYSSWGYQLGIGMSARSHLGHSVYRNHDQLNTYLERVEAHQSPVEQLFPLAEEDRMTQFIGRSMGDGKMLSRLQYERTFGRPIDDDFGDVLTRLKGARLIEDDGEHLAMSETGKLVYDLITLSFYPQRARDWLTSKEGQLVRPAIDAPAAP